MKTLKLQLKLIIFFFIFFNFFNFVFAKNIEKFSNSKHLSNYFSGLIAINNNQYKISYNYFKSLNNLEESHYSYSQYYLYSQIALNKFKDAANYSRGLERRQLDSFESNLVAGIYNLKTGNFEQAKIYFEKLKNHSQPGTMQALISITLNNWSNFNNINSALLKLKSMPDKFENIKNIQEVFAHCFFDSTQTDTMFEKLTSNSKIGYSRYNFFYVNYLNSKKKEKKAKVILKSSLNLYPKNLILNQLQNDISQQQKQYSDVFNCKKIDHVIAEMFYIIANSLSSTSNYIASNFYLNLAKYLNPKFPSFDVLFAENFEVLEKHQEALKIYKRIKKLGSHYDWHASKRIASILKAQEKKDQSVQYLKNVFLKIKNPTIHEIFDYADFLKNNEQFKDSIEYYSKLINSINKKHSLYPLALDGRGVAYERTNQWTKAEIDLINSLKISPDNAYVINYLAYSWIEKEVNIDKSLKMLKKANQLRPNDGYIVDSLGWALFKLNRYKEAKKYMQLAVKLMASDPVINDHFADVLWMNNNSLQARYYWKYVLKLEKTENKLKNKIERKLLFGLKG
ncbi:MAG: tetratricopeptide repeat protein [Pelagibacteraceae bacterium]|jgi:tetratricopeptide (TPR) repeat protein|nr:tetratricopeptide repeat protein [Pelagibacteraceae bacterium]